MSSPFSDSSSTCSSSSSSSAFSFDDTEVKQQQQQQQPQQQQQQQQQHVHRHNAATSSSVFSKLAGTVRDTRSRVEQKKSELNASMQERLPEWRSRGVMYGNRARETSMEWSRKGKEAVDRWKKERQDRPSVDSSSQEEMTINHIFGLPLEKAVSFTQLSDKDYIPAVLRRCISYLDEHGIHEVGIYRVPGSTITVNKLRAIFDTGDDCDFFMTCPDPNVVATLLKLYLRELPEPIISHNLNQQYAQQITRCIQEQEPLNSGTTLEENQHISTDIFDMPSVAKLPSITPELIEAVRVTTSQLPTANLCLLKALCQHLKRVTAYSNENKMSTSNLALIFIPTLGMGRLLFHCMVDHYDHVFRSIGNIISPAPLSSTSASPSTLEPSSFTSAGPITIHSRSKSVTSVTTLSKPLPPPLPQKPKHISIPKPPRRQNKSLDLGRHHQQVRGEHNKTLSDTDLISMTTPPPPKPSRSPVAKPVLEYFRPNISQLIENKTRSRSVSSPNAAPSLSSFSHPSSISSVPASVTTATNSVSLSTVCTKTASSVITRPGTRSRSGSRVEAIGRQFEQLITKSSSRSSSPISSSSMASSSLKQMNSF